MNKEVFKKVLDVYKSKYDYINQADSHHEIYKWTAVETCIENWDIDAKDFRDMFKKSMSMSKNIIENQFVLSISGVIFLCDNGKTEEVRDEFKKLLDAREQQKAEAKEFAESRNNTTSGKSGFPATGSDTFPRRPCGSGSQGTPAPGPASSASSRS